MKSHGYKSNPEIEISKWSHPPNGFEKLYPDFHRKKCLDYEWSVTLKSKTLFQLIVFSVATYAVSCCVEHLIKEHEKGSTWFTTIFSIA